MNNDVETRLSGIEDKLLLAFEQIGAIAANGSEVAVQSAALACLVRALISTHPKPEVLVKAFHQERSPILQAMPPALHEQLKQTLDNWQKVLQAFRK